jgi:N-acetyl-gamma-glutamyl-phosphate reductase
MINVAVLGASGYTALEVIKILLRHPQVKIVACISRQEGTPLVSSIHPSLTKRIDLRCEELDLGSLKEKGVQCVFSCLPHGASMEVIPKLIKAGIRVIDLSADYRLKDPVIYKKWYGEEHLDFSGLASAVYGLPEFNSLDIKTCNLLANPGCYPQTAILGLAPLLVEKLIHPEQIIVDSKSGVSGAGRNPKQSTHFPECNESVSAYQVGKHRHTPEMEQALEKVSGEKVKIMFTPHLIPMDRGIFSTIYAKPKKEISEQAINELVGKFYKDKPFIRLVDHLPATKDSVGTNYVDLHYKVACDYIVVLAAEDNLIRGASGVAVQNFNLMFGLPEVTALLP